MHWNLNIAKPHYKHIIYINFYIINIFLATAVVKTLLTSTAIVVVQITDTCICNRNRCYDKLDYRSITSE